MSTEENQELELDHFIDSLRSGEIGEKDVEAMDARLRVDPELRQRYRARMRMESNLISIYQLEQTPVSPPALIGGEDVRPKRWRYLAAGAGIAAAITFAWLHSSQDRESSDVQAVAKVEKQSEATWAGAMSLTGNAELGAGEIDLRTGIAEIRFVSGVLVSLEAPARLNLIDSMRCELLKGSVVVNVPEGIQGFVVATPEGHVIDHGTSFAVTVDSETSEFGVISGEISVHHAESRTEKTLLAGEGARLTSAGILALETPFIKKQGDQRRQDFLRLRTNGRETSIVRNDQRALRLSPDLLMVKADVRMGNENRLPPENMPKDRRSLIGFNVEGMDLQRISSAKLRMNLVPSGLGFASFLPEKSSFKVYGVRDDASLETWWKGDLKWIDAPGSLARSHEINHAEVELLGTFEIPKGLQEGAITIQTERLTDYLKRDTTGEVGFLVVMTTVPKREWSRVHAFASSEHRDTAGPTLEIELKKSEEK